MLKKVWLKSQLCTIKGRLWQPCGTHTHGFGMVMSSEVWNTCLPRLPIGSWGQNYTFYILPSPRVEHYLCITMEQYLWTTITWWTESYFWRRWWFDQWWTSFFSRFGNLHRRSKQPKTWDDCLCFRCQGSSLCWRCFTAHLELWTLWQSSSKQGKFWWETLQLLSDLYQTMFRVFPLVVCMKLNSETTTTKYYGR